MKCLCYSNRFYYKDLSSEAAAVIKNDLVLYNSMLHTAYKRVTLSCFYGVKEQITPKQLKEKYGTSDYFPLSAINEARGLLKSNIEINKRLQTQCKKRIRKIQDKITKEKKSLDTYQQKKQALIQKSKNHETTEADYLYEVQDVDPKMKQVKNKLSMLTFRLHREQFKLKGLEQGVLLFVLAQGKDLKLILMRIVMQEVNEC